MALGVDHSEGAAGRERCATRRAEPQAEDAMSEYKAAILQVLLDLGGRDVSDAGTRA